MADHTCPACRVPWPDHAGTETVCKALAEVRVEISKVYDTITSLERVRFEYDDAMREAAVLLGLDPDPYERTARVMERLHELRDPVPTEPCAYCARPVDTREEVDGGDPWGWQLPDGRWACSSGCWEMLAIEGDEKPEPCEHATRTLERLHEIMEVRDGE